MRRLADKDDARITGSLDDQVKVMLVAAQGGEPIDHPVGGRSADGGIG
jgi:hypothetical protein